MSDSILDLNNGDSMINKDNNESHKESKIKSILSVLKNMKISVGMDVSNTPVPASLISPFSSLVYFYDNFANGFQLLIQANRNTNELDRILDIYKYLNTVFLINNDQFSKPLVPIVGETQISQFQVNDNGELNNDNYYCVEHIQNNPPYTLSCIYNKKEGIKVYFNHGLKIIFMGTYFKVGFEGAECYIELEKYNEKYTLEIPPLCSRVFRGFSEYCGIGKVHSNSYTIEANYFSKPLFGGKYNYCESNVIKNNNKKVLYKINGQWDKELKITNVITNKTNSFFIKTNTTYTKIQSNIDGVLSTDSSVVWKKFIDAHTHQNNKLKIKEKLKVEDEQKQIENERYKTNTPFKPIHFTKSNDTNKWTIIN